MNGDDLIWFADHAIKEETVVCGYSNGALTAAYMAAYGGDFIKGCVLEDPPVFSAQDECWPAYYLRHCYWGWLFMKDAMPGIAGYAQKYSQKHPGEG